MGEPCDAQQDDRPRAGRPLSRTARLTLGLLSVLLLVGFLSLGTWQLFRLRWKLDLIQRVEARVHAPPGALPEEARWPQVTAASDEYRHVSLTGRYLPQHAVWVQAVTTLGSGFWLLMPLQQADGSIVLVNRGFVPSLGFSDMPAGQTAPDTTVTGLLRVTEPKGAFLRRNDPAHGRWYSRDVDAIARAQGLQRVAPFFVDADAASLNAGTAPAYPVGGLTVIAFHNSHLVYAITWYALAAMTVFGMVLLVREERRAKALSGKEG
ncbi:MAG: SURF1 family protein [Burkholderiales bacterium]|nr:SURF1 family protein [Burkholderiales bacterium]